MANMLMSLRNEAACRVSSFTLVGFIAFHEKAFKLKMKFISLGGLRFGIGLPCGLGVVVQV